MRRARADAEDGDWKPDPGTHDAVVVEGDAYESGAGDVYAKTVLRLVKPELARRRARMGSLDGLQERRSRRR